MQQIKEYRRRANTPVTAVQLSMDFVGVGGFIYEMWGGEQFAKQGDWLVKNGEDTYTVDQEVFATTYREVSPGQFVKTTAVWAEQANQEGSVPTKEGTSEYRPSDYLVSNDEAGTDKYVIVKAKFVELYEEVDRAAN